MPTEKVPGARVQYCLLDTSIPPQGPHAVGIEFNRLVQLGFCILESAFSLRRQGLLNESFALLHRAFLTSLQKW